jgi:hypothetical protein
MNKTLSQISKTVEDKLGHVLLHDTFSLEYKSDGLYLTIREDDKIESHKVINQKALKNDSLIYIVPVDVNGQMEEENEDILQTQVRNSLRSIIGKNVGSQQFSFNSTSICEKINPVWGQLPPAFKRKMRRWVHVYVKEIIEQLVKLGATVNIHEQNYTFAPLEDKIVKSIRRFLLSDKFLETGNDLFENYQQLTIDDFLEVV